MNNFPTPVISDAVKNNPNVQVMIENPVNADDTRMKLEEAFGIAIESAMVAPQFENSPETILKLQTILHRINLNSDKDELSFRSDDLIMVAVNSIEPQSFAIDSENDLAKVYNIPHFNIRNSAQSVFDYLLRLNGQCNSLVKQDRTGLFNILSERVKVQFLLFLRGLLCSNLTEKDVSIVFTKFLLTNPFNCGAVLRDLVLSSKNEQLTDSESCSEVFGPVLDILHSCAQNSVAVKLFDRYCEAPYDVLKTLLDIKLPDNSRPIAQLIVTRPNFHPREFHTKKYHGREFAHTSYLGPFISLSIAGSQSVLYDSCLEDTEIAFTEIDIEYQKEAKLDDFRMRLDIIRGKLHEIIRALVVNVPTRQLTLDYIADLFEKNRKLSQLQADYEQLGNCTAMLNIFSVLLDLSEKIVIEKIQDNYIFHGNCLLKMQEENGIKMDKALLESYKAEIDISYTPNFNTECFYLTLAFLGISLNTMVSNLTRTKRTHYEIQRQVRDAEERIKRAAGQNSAQIVRIKTAMDKATQMLKKFDISITCYECLLYDPTLLAKSTKFVNKFLRLLLRNIIPTIGADLKTFKPQLERFTSFPETFLENGVDFLHFLLGGNGQRFKILLANMSDYPQLILHLVINLENIKNPFLASKIVDLLFYICPDVHPEAVTFFQQIINDPQAVERLFPALVKFYADVESTGSHTEFYDKFNIRRNIQVIFQSMWKDYAHRDRMIKYAGKNSPDFTRFINMVINDTTFLLDESLEKLKKIHEIETQLANETEWGSLSQEIKEQKMEVLSDAKKQVKIWLQLGTETMELFVTLTGDAPQIFRQEALGERVAAMLNHNLFKLCGPNCNELKVHDAKMRFNWDPRKLTELIVKVYVNLSSEQFANQIAQDERSYKPEEFAEILRRLDGWQAPLPIVIYEPFKNLMEMAKKAHEVKAGFEEQFENDAPEEFKCAIMYTLMTDPVTLPSGQVVDRKNILRHLLSDPHNPFSRQPMKEEDLMPNVEIKQQIMEWIESKKNNPSNK